MGYVLNKSIIMGHCTNDAELRVTAGDNPMHIARYTVAVNRQVPQGAEGKTDFISCVAFGKQADTAEKYFRKGTKVFVCGRIQTGSYTNKDGVRIPTFEIVVEDQGMVESKKDSQSGAAGSSVAAGEGFMNIPDGLDEEIPYFS